MDPLACLIAVETAIYDSDDNKAAELLDSYVNWRGIGGSEPTVNGSTMNATERGFLPPVLWTQNGDNFHRDMVDLYESTFGEPYLDARLPDDN